MGKVGSGQSATYVTQRGRIGGCSTSGRCAASAGREGDNASPLAHGSLGSHLFSQHNCKWRSLLLSRESEFGWC